jgi:hypothetical protein
VQINPADVADGVLVNAVWAVGQMVVRPRESRRAAAGMDTAGWMDTERLTAEELPGARLELPELTDAEAAELETALKRDEVQGALQALLAARLTDAPEMDAARAREVVAVRLAARAAVRLAVGGAVTSTGESVGTATAKPDRRRSSSGSAGSSFEAAVTGVRPVAARYAEQLSEYFDDKISALVATIEGRVGFAGLAQVRAEAYNSRIVALLATIADMLAALSHPDRGGPEEAEFLRRYRRQVRERHGKIEPPDFERRRKVPVEKIYVNTPIYERLEPTSPLSLETYVDISGLKVKNLAGLVDRTVLLGDPGGGKTTAANVLANLFASDINGKVPFLVTLREYSAQAPPERSVAGHIEHTLETMYQCPAPHGLVERVLLTERAVVIFDGLDELLDTSRRRDVSELVEQFCSAYPLTPVLITSRLVGYDQARLDDDQFTCYRLGNFDDDQVAEYTHKWFAVQEGATTSEAKAEANAFLTESTGARDIRSNPLLLSLMCILYRGAGSLPRDRADVYEQCANLLFRRWDARRRIHQELHAGSLVESAIRHLAWWLFNREDPLTAVTERQLIAETTGFLYRRGFESEEEARGAAGEFVEFCQGRMWVLNEAGTTEDGEKLYAFTHRTFLEYFSAAYLAAVCDSPEDLARALSPHVENQGWNIVGKLAIQIKDRNTDRGADRIFAAFLDSPINVQGESTKAARIALLCFLARSLESTNPSPFTVREITKAVLDFLLTDGMASYSTEPLETLLTFSGRNRDLICDETSSRISEMLASNDPEWHMDSLRMVLFILFVTPNPSPWRQWSEKLTRNHAAEIVTAAIHDATIRKLALFVDVISLEHALSMPGGLGALMERTSVTIPRDIDSFPIGLLDKALDQYEPNRSDYTRQFATIGKHLLDLERLPWIHISEPDNNPPYDMNLLRIRMIHSERQPFPEWHDELPVLGIAAVMFMGIELTRRAGFISRTGLISRHTTGHQKNSFGSLLYRYITRRLTRQADELPDLPVPFQFRQAFLEWAENRVNFVDFIDEK